MKKQKLTGLIALVMLAVFAAASFAATGKYNAANYQNYGYKYNCFMFVRQVLLNERAQDSSVGYFNSYTNDYLHFYSYVGGSLVAEHINKNSGTPSQAQIKAAFQKAQVGDVVQMYWKWGTRSATQHTALIADIGNDYVEFLESNNPSGQITNHYYSYGGSSSKSVWGNLQTLYSNPGNKGGFSIYRFHTSSEPAPEITDVPRLGSTGNIVAGKSFSFQCRANGNVTAWSISEAAIPSGADSVWNRSGFPAGLAINSTTGLISGTTEHNTNGKVYYNPLTYHFNVNASNSGGTSSIYRYIRVWEPPYITTSQKLPDGSINSSYDQEIFAEGTEGTMKWQFLYGSLPPGLQFTHNLDSRVAHIKGTPTQSGTYTFKVQCSNYKHDPETTTTKVFQIEVKGGNDHIDSNLRPIYGYFVNGKVGQSYSDYEQCYNAEPDGLVVEGDYPEGLKFSLSGKYIRLRGTPTKAGTYKFKLHPYKRDGGYWNSNEYTMTIDPGSSPMSIVYVYGIGKRGVFYDDYVKVTGGTRPYTPSIVGGRLPYGTHLEQFGALTFVSGIPTRAENANFTLRVTDANGSTVEKSFTIRMVDNTSYRSGAPSEDSAVKPSISSKVLPNATVGNEWESVLEAYGTQPITWFASDLPEGFSIEDDTGRIHGIPTKMGKYRITVTAENEVGSEIKRFYLKVFGEKPIIQTRALPDAVLNVSYEIVLDGNGTAPLRWKRVSGQLPPGMDFNKKEGKIEGTPTKAGTYSFSIQLGNSEGSDSVDYTLVVKEKEEEKSENTNETSSETSSETQSGAKSGVGALTQNASAGFTVAYTSLYMLSNDEKLEGSVVKKPGDTNFVIGEWVDTYGRKINVSDVKIFVNDKFIDGVKISDDGTFTLSKDVMSNDTTVYASALNNGRELKTSEIYVSAAGADEEQNASGSSGAGCSIGASIASLLLCAGAFMKKK